MFGIPAARLGENAHGGMDAAAFSFCLFVSIFSSSKRGKNWKSI